MSDDGKKAHALSVLDQFLDEYIVQTQSDDEDIAADDEDIAADDMSDGVFDYSLNLLKSFMVLLDCKDAVASGNGEHLAIIQKHMLLYFSSVSGCNSYAIEMLISTIQNEVLLSPAEAHQCKWAGLANWKGGRNKNIEIDLLQENRNKDIKGLIQLMGTNKTEKAIDRVSRAAGGVRKIVDVPIHTRHLLKMRRRFLLTCKSSNPFLKPQGGSTNLWWEFHLTHLKIWIKKSSVHGCKDTRETLQYTFLHRLIHVVRKRIICKMS